MDSDQNNLSAQQPLVRDFNNSSNSFFTPKLIIILVAIVLIGVGSGYLLGTRDNSSKSPTARGTINTTSLSKGTIIGSSDTKTFKDNAEGALKEGGVNGEGAYHLVRPGGDSQNVYLTSSSVDLSQLVGKKVKVWGETQKAVSAGWLMDVGRVEILQ